VSFNLFALCNAEFFSWIIRTSSVFDSRRVWTSRSACLCSSALKQDISLAFIDFPNVRYASVSFSSVRYFSSVSAEIHPFFLLDVCRAPYTGVRTFLIVVFAGHGNLQYYHIEILLYWNQFIYCSWCFRTWKLTVVSGVHLCYLHSH